MNLSLSEYYLWKKKSSCKFPWERQHLNADFYKYEQKRLNDLRKWYNNFITAPEGCYLDEVSYYTLPIDLKPALNASIASIGNYKPLGLSAICNDCQSPVIALFDGNMKLPEEYQLIRIVKSRKTHLVRQNSAFGENAIIVDDWEVLKPDLIYVDIDYEKNSIKKVLQELSSDEQISLPLQLPLISSPYKMGDVGGIALSSLSAKSTFAIELVKTIQLMAPPQYRVMKPPKSVHNGKWFPYTKDISFRVAERAISTNNLLSGVTGKSYNPVLNEIARRNKFDGEYSIFSTLFPEQANTSQFFDEMFKNYAETDVTLPFELDEMPQIMDVDLTNVKKAIDEDLWLQVVHSRQFNPKLKNNVDKKLVNTIENLKQSLEMQFSDVFRSNAGIKYRIDKQFPAIKDNLMRISQSLARTEEKNDVTVEHLKRGKGIIDDTLYELMKNETVIQEKRKVRSKKTSARFDIVKSELVNNQYSTLLEIWENVKSTGEFRDIEDLAGFLDWLHRKGFIIKDKEGRYYWIGYID